MPNHSKRRILPIFHSGSRYNKISNKQDKEDNESRFLSSQQHEDLLLLKVSDESRQVRSSPSMRHLSADGSSGAQLQELLEKVASSSAATKTIKKRRNSRSVSVVSRFRNRLRGEQHRTSTQTESMNINLISNVRVSEPKEYTEDIEDASESEAYGVVKVWKESKRSIFTDESSGAKLQSILEKLVEQDSKVDTTKSKDWINQVSTQVVGVESNENYVTSMKLSKDDDDVIDTARTSFDELENTNEPSTRFEMFDPNEQSKLYLQQRQRQGKKAKRRLPSRPERLRSRNVLKNCGLIPELQLSPGSTISMSSCSLDSVLDDHERLEKYRLLSQPPPSPPPRRNSDQTVFMENTWTDNILKTIWETHGKISRLFGCAFT